MVLDSPLSMERRGVLLYDYCKRLYPNKLADLSIAWIEAGYSLKKEPAGDIIKIKHLDAYINENGYQLSVEYGTSSPSHRYYLLTTPNGKFIFGYDSEAHQSSPLFKAVII